MRYHNITKDDMLNGDGLRVVLWVSGCVHACPGCHNPVTWDPFGGLLFDCAAKDEIFAELEKDYVNGVTFSGGDPLYDGNAVEIAALAKEIKEKFPDKTIWLYTGSKWEDVASFEAVKLSDVVVDGRFIKAFKDNNLHWKGSSNQRVIDVKKTLQTGEITLHV
ncbi:MAG: anaerobic ribonucleoside-triphosphate reductase activating protein [Lachnospiraceae bacterium]|jgi:anaerobic ribonucleoside-triphosphate reductase activating protein|nr:anaerobic ribonucleoside-triphosphate reductase activating protein [Lachnospiraceae bacterium]